MKIAFATEDLERVDAHFGWAKHIVVYEVSKDSHTRVAVHLFEGDLKEDGNEGKLESKLEAVSDCAILYVGAIGGSAAARVVAKKVHPIKVSNPQSIEELLSQFQGVLRGTPPPWLRKAFLKGEVREFTLEEEAPHEAG